MDEYGYPTEHELRKIRKWDAVKDVDGLLDFIELIWRWPKWGFKKRVGYRKIPGKRERCVKLELHTGGWSGNEQIMYALERNKIFWLLYWESSRRGGHYYFEIRSLKGKETK